ncbi:hypothetical protein ACVWZK_001696 [Bradyrhizobium sp. GM0.4]
MNSLSTGDTLLTVAVMTSAFLDIEQRKSIRHRDWSRSVLLYGRLCVTERGSISFRKTFVQADN